MHFVGLVHCLFSMKLRIDYNLGEVQCVGRKPFRLIEMSVLLRRQSLAQPCPRLHPRTHTYG